MKRRFRYALSAGLLSLGAPLGLLGVRLARRPAGDVKIDDVMSEIAVDRTSYAYVGGTTALIFALFGYVLGRQADQLARQSETDPLTRLYNARGFIRRLRLEIRRARRYRDPLTLMFMDCDGLKAINDRHGHREGSLALRNVARVIRAELRETDVGARWGGDEFTILAPNTSKEAAQSLADRIRTRIADTASPWKLSASIGIATLDASSASHQDPDTLMRAADTAMYEAKRRGKNQVVTSEV